ncbi:MAG: winged helix-turn-helix domain-containing protein [Myxococcota bacterium]
MAQGSVELLGLDTVTIDFVAREVLRDTTRIRLTPIEHALLRYFVANPNRLITQGELLEHVWDVRPSTQTHTVYVTINRLRKKIEPDPRRPTHILNSPGAGYRFWLEVEPRARSFPTPRTDFIGRTDELKTLTGQLSSPGLITLLGPAGMGKTRLALALLEMTLLKGVFVDLSEAVTPDEIARAVSIAVGCPLNTADPAQTLDHALDALGDALIVFDNVEQAVGAAPETVGRWRAAAPALRIVITSRRRLGLSDERVFDLEPLPPGDAVQLFLDRAQAVRSTFDASPAALGRLVDALDGLPLAIELAANRARVMDADQLTDALQQQLDVLSRGGLGLAPRHRSLRAALQGSWALLDAPAQRTLAALSVFCAPFTLEAAAAVCATDDTPWIPDVLQQLLDHSMLRLYPQRDGPPRLSMLASIRAFASEAAEAADLTPARARHAAWFARFGTVAAIKEELGSPARRMARISERDDLRAAQRTLEASGDIERSAGVLAFLAELSMIMGPIAPSADAVVAFLRAHPGLDDENRRRLTVALSRQYHVLGRHTDGVALIEEALDAAAVPADQGALHLALARHQLRQMAFRAANRSFARALAAFRRDGDLHGQGEVALGLSHRALTQGDQEEAEGHAARAVDRFRASGDDSAMEQAEALITLAGARLSRQPQRAETRYRSALDLCRAAGDGYSRTYAKALHGLALCLAKTGRHDDAFVHFEEVWAIVRRFGDVGNEAVVLSNYGSWKIACDHLAEGRQYLERALALAQRAANKRVEALTLSGLGHLELSEGNLSAAQRRLEDAITLSTKWGWGSIILSDYAALSKLYLLRGELDHAARWLDRATELETEMDSPMVSAVVCCRRAALSKAQGDRAGAKQWLARGRALAETAGTLHSAKFQSLLQQIEADL